MATRKGFFKKSADFVIKGGPYELPNDGKNGALQWNERQEILQLTGVSAAVRDRKQTKGKRHLTLSGPLSGFELAYEMAMQFIVKSQVKQEPFAETPGCDGDWVATEQQRSRPAEKSRKVAKSSTPMAQSGSAPASSWQPMMPAMQQPMMQPMMPMMHPMMQQQWMQQQQAMMMMANPMMMQSMMMQPLNVQRLRKSVHAEKCESSSEDDDNDSSEPMKVEIHPAKVEGKPATQPAAKDKPEAVVGPKVEANPATRPKTKIEPKQPAAPPPGLATPPAAASGLRTPPLPPLPARYPWRLAKDEHDIDEDEGPEPSNTERSLATKRAIEDVGVKKRRLITWKQRDPTTKYVHLMSVGWRQQEVEYTKIFKNLVEGEAGLLHKLKFRGIPEPDVIIDCRMFKTSGFERVVNHTGYHTLIIQQTVDHPFFKNTIKEAIDMVHEESGHDKDIVVLSVCTSGCHRSVAVTLILQSILQEMLYHVKVRHLSSGSWGPRNLCKQCEACDNKNPLKLEMFKAAFQKVRK